MPVAPKSSSAKPLRQIEPRPVSRETRPLFRSEAVEQVRNQLYGEVLLASPLSHWLVTLLAVLFGATLVTILATVTYSRKMAVSGVLLPEGGLVGVRSIDEGVVSQRLVTEGATVTAGAPMVVIRHERSTTSDGSGRTLESLLTQREESLSVERAQLERSTQSRVSALEARMESLAAESAQLRQQQALQHKRVANSELSLQRLRDLQSAGYVSPARSIDAEADLLDQQQRLADLARARTAAERAVKDAQAEMRDLHLQAARQSETVHRNVLDAQRERMERLAPLATAIRAPIDGTVTALNADNGQSVEKGSLILTISPQGAPLEAHLYAPSQAMGFIKPGMEVILRHDAFSYQKFGHSKGKVLAISPAPLPATELALARGRDISGPVYRIRVRLDRQSVRAYDIDEPLKAGSSIEATVVLERRKLYEWVLEPLYTISGRLP